MKTQNFENHTRWYPLVHFIVMPMLTANLFYQFYRFGTERSLDRAMQIVLAAAVILGTIAARFQALRVQDRLIKTEERLRYERLLSPEKAAAALERLRARHIISLRFASDEELPSLIERVISGELNTSKEIKREIKNWRPDHFRV